MTRAEERALEAYPNDHFVDHTYAEMCRGFYEEGYEQAEKDLALTWEDAQLLHIITEKYMRELDNRIEAFPSSSQEVFEEILRRFKEAKK